MRKQSKRRVVTVKDPLQLLGAVSLAIPKDRADKMALRELTAIESFRDGSAGIKEWSQVFVLAHVAQQCATEKGHDVVAGECTATLSALKDALARYQRTGKMGMTGAGLNAIRSLAESHHVQRNVIPWRAYERLVMSAVHDAKHQHGTVMASLKTMVEQATIPAI